jgi:hypothetical protein
MMSPRVLARSTLRSRWVRTWSPRVTRHVAGSVASTTPTAESKLFIGRAPHRGSVTRQNCHTLPYPRYAANGAISGGEAYQPMGSRSVDSGCGLSGLQ